MEQLRALEECMRIQAEDEEHGVYLPNPQPLAPVQYVLLCMEPSWDGWAKTLSVEEARKKVHVKGFRNFLAVDPKDIGLHILQFCAQHYLCRPGENYYLTDVSKGAMKGKQADHQR